MKCPLCDIDVIHQEREDIEITFCPLCGRVFVDEDPDEILEPLYVDDEDRSRGQRGASRWPGGERSQSTGRPSETYLG